MFTSLFSSELELRKDKIQFAMRKAGADSFLICNNVNLYYTSGRIFNGYTYIPAEGQILYFVRRPIDLKGDQVIYIHKPEQIPEFLQKRGLSLPRTLLLETDSISYNEYTRLNNLFHPEKTLNGSQLIREVRAIKTPYEIEQIKESGTKHASMYHKIPAVYQEGMSDTELSIEIERLARLHGSLGLFRVFGSSMEIYMGSILTGDNADQPSPYDFAMGGSGLNSSLPIGCNGTLIKPGMTVMVDMGGNFTGYMTDMTRIFSVGNTPDSATHAHRTAIEIQNAVIESVRPGVSTAELYQLAVELAKKAKLDAYFMGHKQQAGFIGHGIGIEINELPVFSPRSKDILAEGMVFALEPKFVIPHVGAVGIENTFVVTASGCEKITICNEEIISLD